MLFHVSWQFANPSEEGQRRSLRVLQKWQPPAGAQFQGFYHFADGSGGFAIIEVDSAATMARTTAPWTPWLRFTVTPIIPQEEATHIDTEAQGFLASIP
jgi:hypothetical protein